MRKLQTVCAAAALLLTLTVAPLAGEMDTPKTPPPQVNGQMDTPQKSPVALGPLTEAALTALQSLLTLF